jgi:hypothetical protein
MPSRKPEASDDESVEREELDQALKKFWLEIDDVVSSSCSGSMLRDMGRVEINLRANSLPDTERVSPPIEEPPLNKRHLSKRDIARLSHSLSISIFVFLSEGILPGYL